MRNNRLFGFQHRYPQAFLDELAKMMGIEWIPVNPTLVPKENISVQPLPPPCGKLYYIETKYK
jgi:hypothetical protein